MDLEQFQVFFFFFFFFFCSLLEKSGVKIFIVKFFYELKLYLLICSQRPSARGSVLGPNQLSCSLCCLPLEALSALDSPIGGSQGNERRLNSCS